MVARVLPRGTIITMIKFRSLFVLLTVLFVLASLFGFYAVMSGAGKSAMKNCPLMSGMASLCQMNIFEHITQWQLIFSALPTAKNALSGFFIASLLFALVFLGKRVREGHQFPFVSHDYTHDSELKLHNFLLIAFSRGILHSRIHPFLS